MEEISIYEIKDRMPDSDHGSYLSRVWFLLAGESLPDIKKFGEEEGLKLPIPLSKSANLE